MIGVAFAAIAVVGLVWFVFRAYRCPFCRASWTDQGIVAMDHSGGVPCVTKRRCRRCGKSCPASADDGEREVAR